MQAYYCRLCLGQGGDRIAIARPDAYDPDRYELLLRRIAAEQTESLDELFIISPMPNGKTDWNYRGRFSTDYIGKNWDYPEADYERRAELATSVPVIIRHAAGSDTTQVDMRESEELPRRQCRERSALF